MATISDSVLRAAQKVNKLLTNGGKQHGLTPRQVEVLIMLSEEPGLSQAEMMDRCSMDRSTMSSVMKLMERKGLVTRVRSKEDSRAFVIELTSIGKALVKQAKKLRDQVEGAIEGVMGQPLKTTHDLAAIAAIPIEDEN